MTRRAFRSAGWVTLTAAVVLIGCGRRLEKEEIDRLVDQRLAERGLAPAPSTSGSSGPAPSNTNSGAAKNDDPAVASIAFLGRLDDLMKDFKPSLPIVEDKSDVLRCLTTDARSNPDLRRAVTSMKGRLAATKQEAQRRTEEFYKKVFPLAYHYDLDWATRRGSIPPEYGCSDIYDGEWSTSLNTQEDCEGYAKYTKRVEWKLRQPGRPGPFVYSNSESPPTAPPELMRRMEAARLQPPARFSCRVEDVMRTRERHEIKCRTGASPAMIQTSGELHSLNVGDVVSVPLAGVKRDPDGVLSMAVATKTWVIDADAATLTVDAAASCPTVAEVVASLVDGGSK